MGLDSAGTKHLLGIKPGDTENPAVVKALLTDLVQRGIAQAMLEREAARELPGLVQIDDAY